VPATQAETDPSVCYRHPDRTSWTLCTRCGRTICPECQILTPAGVRCPDCVRETGGSVRWEPTAGGATARAKKTGMRRTRQPGMAERVSASTLPVLTIGVAGVSVLVWIAGFITANASFFALAAFPDVAWQVWRYVTSAVTYPAGGGSAIISTLLSIGIFVYISWGAERQLGRRRFFELFLFSSAGAAALSLLVGVPTFGLSGPIWGVAGAYVIAVWPHPASRNRLLISLAIWFVITLFLGGNIFAVIGGLAAGIGATLLFRAYSERSRSRPSTPYLIVVGAIAVIAVLAILRNTFLA
jgi:membrane associated rhomboid family serine protease